MPDTNETLRDNSLDDLTRQCAQQTDLFYHGRENDPRYCFEVFRRAILERDPLAWEAIHRVYGEQLVRWARRHPAFASAGEEADYFVNRALEKMWLAVPPHRFAQFPALKHLLGYLQLCMHSVIMDYRRAQAESALLDEASLEESYPDPVPLEERVEARNQSLAVWKLIVERLKDLKEVQVAHDSFVIGLKPAEIIERSPGQYQSIQEIYRIKENILERLHRDLELMIQLGISPESKR